MLGRGSDMRRSVPGASLLAHQPEVRERTRGRGRAAYLKRKVYVYMIHIYTHIYISESLVVMDL